MQIQWVLLTHLDGHYFVAFFVQHFVDGAKVAPAYLTDVL